MQVQALDTKGRREEMKDLSETVKKILEEHPDARDDDFKVIGYVVKELSPTAMTLTFGQALWNHNKLGLPNFETIRRTRQKLQQDNPDLRGTVYEERMRKQTEYKDMFTGRKVS